MPFANDVTALKESILPNNPFTKENLCRIGTTNQFPNEVMTFVSCIPQIGQYQLKQFILECLIEGK